MIILSRTTSGTNGRMKIRNFQSSGRYDNTARISRAKTLDGECALNHSGVTDQDRNFDVDCRLSASDLAVVKSYFEDAVLLRISTWEGAYCGYLQKLTAQRDGATKMIFYFKEKLT